jgi:PAS domain S-box-containing protein
MILLALNRDGIITLLEGRDPGVGLAESTHLFAMGESGGVAAGALVGRSIFELAPDQPEIAAQARRALAGETLTTPLEWHGIVLEMRWIPLRDDAGAVAGAIAVATDVSERTRQAVILTAIPDLIFRISRAGELLDVQASQESLLLVPREAIIGHTLSELLPPEVAQASVRAIAQALGTGTPQVMEYALPLPGGRRYFEARHVVSGPDEVLCIARDITGLRRAERARAAGEAALRQSEERFRVLIEAAPVGICVMTTQDHFAAVNDAYCALTGYTREELLAGVVGDLHPHEEREAHLAQLHARFAAGASDPVEFTLLTKQGERRTVLGRGTTVAGPGGPPQRLGFVVDISARKAMEEELRASEARFRTLTEHSSDITRVLDANGTIRYASPSHQTVLGYDPATVLGCNTVDFLPPEVVEQARAILAGLVAAGGRRQLVCRIRHADGTYRTFETILDNQLDNPAVRGVVVNARDITERLAAEAARWESEAAFRRAFEQAPTGMTLVTPDGRLRQVNRVLCQMLGYTEQELLGLDFRLLIHPDDQAVSHEMFRQLRAGEIHTLTLEKRCVHKEGRELWCEVTTSLLRDAEGVPLYFINQLQDISARRAAVETQAQLAAIVSGSSDAIIGRTLAGTITSWNAGAERLYGYTAAEAIGRSTGDLLAVPGDPQEGPRLSEALLRGEVVVNLETERRHRDGRRLAVSISVSPIKDARGAIVGAAGIHRDITARKAAERAVEEARAFAEAMDRVSFALAATLDPDRLYQIILEQAMAVLPCDYASIFLYRDGWAWEIANRGEETASAGTRLFPVSGPARPWLATDHPGAVYLPDTDLEPRWVQLAPQVGEQRIRSVIGVPLRIEGEALGAFQIHSHTPQRYDARHLALAEAFGARVVQALRNAQLYAQEQQRAREAEDFAQLQRDFLGAVSHELLTPLTAIKGLAQLLRTRWASLDEERRDRSLEGLDAAANRQQRLVQDLLDVSRAEAEGFACERQPFALRPVMERAAAEVQASYRGQRIDLHGPTAVVEGDAGRTEQILVNLIDNAAKYSPEGSPVTVSWGLEHGWMVVRVRDHGRGIPAEGREQLFTRFGRLAKSAVRAGRSGTGLGLYLSRLLARAMGGELDLESTGLHGSTFKLLLPSAPQT